MNNLTFNCNNYKKKTYSIEMTYTENEILDGFVSGNRSILEWAYVHFIPNVAGFIKNRGGDPNEAPEVIHETVIIIHLNIKNGKYKSSNKFEYYFVKVAMNVWSSQQKKKRKRNEGELKDELLNIPDEDNSEAIAKQIKANSEKLNKFQEAFKKLKELCRKIIHEHHIQKKKLKDIAAELEMKPGTIRVRIIRCRKKLDELMLSV